MSISYWQDQANGKTKTCDVAIVGGGVTGLSIAYWLKKEDPSLNVLLLEKGGAIGSGATGRNAGFITCGSVEHFNRLCERWGEERALEIWRFSEINLNLLREHIIQDDTELEFDDRGTFSLASTDGEFNELKSTAALMQKLDIAVEVLQERDVTKRLGARNFVGGIKYLKDASIHPLKLIKKLAARTDVVILPDSEVFAIESNAAGGTLLRTQNFNVESTIAVLALNGYSAALSPYFRDKIYPTRGQIMATEPVAPFMEGPCYANFVLDYFRQLDDGRVLIGGFRQLEKTTEVGYSDHITDTIQAALYEFLQKHIPILENRKVTHRWAGVMGFSADGQPLVGSLPDQPSVYFAGGYTGHGLGLAFHSAKVLIDLINGRDIPSFVSARRF